MKTAIYKHIIFISLLVIFATAIASCSKERLEPKEETGTTAGADSVSVN